LDLSSKWTVCTVTLDAKMGVKGNKYNFRLYLLRFF
jgi:hypothetical protein